MNKLAAIIGKAALVVKSARIDKSAECQVEIVARKSGLMSWLLSLLGIDATFTFRVFRDRIESEEGSLSGRINTVVPLAALDTYTHGFTKPITFLIMAFAMLVLSIAMFINSGALGTLFLILAVVFVVRFFLMQSLLLSFSTMGANGIVFVFKRSVIEGVNVDENLAKEVYELVKENYIAQVVD